MKNSCAIISTPRYTRFYESDQFGQDLKSRLRAEIESLVASGITHFLCGMSRGIDTDAAEIILDLQKIYPLLSLEAVLPHELQAVHWSESDRDRYFDIIERSTKETLLQTHYSCACCAKHRRYLIEHANVVLLVCGSKTAYIPADIRFAETIGKKVHIV